LERDSHSSGSTRTGEVSNTVSAERQYESYLEARLQQALNYLRAVREECGLDKWTPEQDQKVQQALQALQNARNELNAQRRKTVEVEKESALKRMRRGLRTAVSRRESTAPRNAERTRDTTAPLAKRSSPVPAAARKPTPVARPGDRHITPPVVKKRRPRRTPKTSLWFRLLR